MAARLAADAVRPAPPRAPAPVPAPAPARVPVPARGDVVPAALTPGEEPGLVRLRYLARAPILVRGVRSGASYRFSEQQHTQAVQRADAQALLATGHFRRE